jgi:hypothetical protein
MNIYWNEVHKGSSEHYWHFLFGYYLPLMRLLLQEERGKSAQLRLYDCGPLMNRILTETLVHLHLKPEFDKSLSVESRQSANGIVLERWDIRVGRNDNLDALMPPVLETREALAAMLTPWSCCNRHLAKGKYLILQRSAEPSFYQAGGGARRATYGAGRRVLKGIKEGHAELEAAGVPCLIYEPGVHNLACQINHFSDCAGVIAVRGAEVTNVLWSPVTARIVIFQSNGTPQSDSSHKILAGLLGQGYFEIPHKGEVSPLLDVPRIIEYLKH